jgi:hypothetical protein
MIEIPNMPVNAAFEIFAKTWKGEIKLGTVCIPKGSTSWGVGVRSENLKDRFYTIDIILRSSETVAKGSVDMTEIWDGEIVLPNIAIGP